MSGSDESAVERRLHLRCNCGWEARGTRAEIVTATQEHVRDVHWQEVSEEEVLERAEPES
jgi:predicted small metal-binding protein